MNSNNETRICVVCKTYKLIKEFDSDEYKTMALCDDCLSKNQEVLFL